ncbi:rho guanine nucleotide exchange factor 40 [Bombina bombina]|uniref:rho guanine nucleotide exchange factor 40 n=1 Tax=Bombina bombina TaxID=8345 RepID=UPI00235B1843|nr:rho guanine nucleotide exchange factor 40 [Bombina bombina]
MTPQSVEDCLQSTLSSLYPPFEVTAPTLLTQVFSVLERTYREDPLRYTLEFLIPAKRILQSVQHQACSQYSGFLFFHEGWPLCLGEKILIQLSSLPWHFLKPGDFYLQVVPYLECSPRLVLKCLSQDGSGVQEIVVPETSHSFLFTAEWLNSINKDRSSIRLENCLAAVEEKFIRLAWSEIIYPRFIHKDGFIVGRRCPPCPLMPPLESRSPGDGGIASGELVEPKINVQLLLPNDQGDIQVWQGGAISPIVGSFSTPYDSLEGEYVELSPPRKCAGGNTDVYKDTWVCRAKTAPSRKGKKKGHQAWLHQKRPAKVGSLSTLKGRELETWEERSCTGAANDQCRSKGEETNYWDIDTTNSSTENNVLIEWRKGLDILQRYSENDVSNDVWVLPERQAWVSKEEQKEENWEFDGSLLKDSVQEDESLSSRLEGCFINVSIASEKENVFIDKIEEESKRELSGDDPYNPTRPSQTDPIYVNQRDLVSDSNEGYEVDSTKQILTENRGDTVLETSHSREASVTRRDRSWADGQETEKVQESIEDLTTDNNNTLGDGISIRSDKEKPPTWSQITETPQRTGRGRRKKRNKRGRGPLRAEARKIVLKTEQAKNETEQAKNDIQPEEPHSIMKSKEEEEEKRDWNEKIENSKLDLENSPSTTPTNQSDEPSILKINTEPDETFAQSALLQGSAIADMKCLIGDVNWDLLESGLFSLTGGQDKDKRALLLISPEKVSAAPCQSDFKTLLLYLHSLLRPELRELGMTLIMDIRNCSQHQECYMQLLKDNQDSLKHCLHCILFLCNSENAGAVPQDLLYAQVLVVLESELPQFVETEELPENLGGNKPYVHHECVRGQRSLGSLFALCSDVLHSLEEVTKDLDTESTQDIQGLISHHRDAMKRTLNDERLQRLQRDGGTLVARLQKSSYLRLYDPATFELYEKVDEALHQLVQLSNQKLQELEAKLPPHADWILGDPLALQDKSRHRDLGGENHGIPPVETRSPEEDRVQVSEVEDRKTEVGVRIRGLEVSSRELADRTCSPPRGHVLSRGDGRGPDAPWGGIPRPEGKRSPQRMLLDLLCSERSYIQSLRRSLEVRGSCPAGLALRGSLEQLLNFHTHFLRDLQTCVSHPLTVSYCFLQHADQLRLYSLYVKNRQKVELFLPAPSGSLKGRRRDQKEEEESWGILHRPLEQLDQYQRFLGDMIQECDQESEQERQSLQAASELVISLVPHGKNLLAAEAIRGFEVDEKEHGRLLIKDTFTVCSGRKKSLRHVFLFQKLLLLSKLKTAEGGLETYGYKQSFKTADMGLTDSVSEGDTRFELWFRRPKSRETLVLQAENPGVKEIWVNEITKLLWDQGGLSKEHRAQDTSSLSSSHRSFLDIKAGISAISERTVSALLTARGSRTRSSAVLPSFEHTTPTPPSSLSFALTSGPSPRRLRSPGGMSLSDKISEEGSESFTGGPVCLKSISPISEGEKPKGLTMERVFPSTSV